MNSSPTPLQVTGVSFASLSAGAMHTCGLDNSGTAYCWGDNLHGQLGYATTEMCGDSGTNTVIDPCATTPHPVVTQLRFVSLALGFFHTCGLTADGSVYCWGQNDHGQLGDGTTTDRGSSTRVRDTK